MRVLCVIAMTALAVLAGCGDGDDNGSEPESAVAKQLSSWSDAAGTYNQFLQNCQVFRGETDVVPRCTRKSRVAYARQTAAVRRALAAARQSSPECGRATAQAQSLVDELTDLFGRAYRTYVAAAHARETGREYRGPPPFPVLAKVNRLSKRDAKAAGTLAQQLRESCSA